MARRAPAARQPIGSSHRLVRTKRWSRSVLMRWRYPWPGPGTGEPHGHGVGRGTGGWSRRPGRRGAGVAGAEAAHPGIGPSNCPDTFRDADESHGNGTPSGPARHQAAARDAARGLRLGRETTNYVLHAVAPHAVAAPSGAQIGCSTECVDHPAGKSWEATRHRRSGASRPRRRAPRWHGRGSSPREVGRVGVHTRRSPPARRHATAEPRAAPTVAGRNPPLAPAPVWHPGLAAVPARGRRLRSGPERAEVPGPGDHQPRRPTKPGTGCLLPRREAEGAQRTCPAVARHRRGGPDGAGQREVARADPRRAGGRAGKARELVALPAPPAADRLRRLPSVLADARAETVLGLPV